MKKPTPDELAKLRAAYPKGAPRIDYREMALRIGKSTKDALTDPAAGSGEVDNEDLADGGADEDAERAANAPIAISISSEAPVLRYDWWGTSDDPRYWEVLDHSPSSVVLDYARDGLPFVASHRSWDADQQHGIVNDIVVQKKTLRGDVKMSRAQRSQEIAQDMRDGIRKKVSVGYVVGDQYTQTKGGADGIPIRRYTAWMPLEVSTVPIPADYDVGVGRAASPHGQSAIARFLELVPPTAPVDARAAALSDPAALAVSSTTQAPKAEERIMPPENGSAPSGAAGTTEGPKANAGPASGEGAATQIRITGDEVAAQRIEDLTNIATQHAIPAKDLTSWIREGVSVSKAIKLVNEVLAERLAKPAQTVTGPQISEKDKRRFSFARALMLNTDLQKECPAKIDFGFERELMQELERTTAPQKGGNILPMGMLGRAGIDSSVASTGGAFKFTEPGDFIPILRNKTSVLRAGATVLTGLTGPMTFPKQIGTATAVFSAENPGADIAVSNLTNSTVTLAFKSIAAGTAFSRQMLFSAASGNYNIEAIVENDIAAVVGLALDLGALNGSGSSNQPKGILQNTNIGSVTLGGNGGTMAWGNWVDLETKIGVANADGSRMSYLTNSQQRGTAKKSAVLGNTASGIPIWTGVPGEFDGQVNGYRALASQQVPSNLTKGTSTTVCSSILFGAFEHLLIGMFGAGFETIVDPYSRKFQGMIEVTAWSYMDCQSRYDGAFASVQDAL